MNLMPRLFRFANQVNPSSHGRVFVMKMAERFKALPEDGIYPVAPGLIMDLQPSDFIERAIYFDAFEFLLTRAIRQYLRPGAVFVDVGANIGYYTLQAARRVGPHGRVIAFEPNPITAARLRCNLTLNREDRVELFEMALSDQEGTVKLHIPLGRTHGETSLRDQGWGRSTDHSVRAKPMDAALPDDLNRIDLIKVDVEGAELQVFEGGQQTIKRFKPAVVLEANRRAARSFGHDPLDPVRILLAYNPDYRLKYIGRHVRRKTSLDELTREPEVSDCNLLLY